MRITPQYLLNERVLSDLAKRSRIGIPLYIILWTIIIVTTDFYQQAPLFSFLWLGAFVIIAGLRMVHQRLFDQLIASYPTFNYYLLIAGVLSSAIFWGFAFAVIMLTPQSQELQFLMVMTTAGLCSGGYSAYTPDRRLAIGYMSIMLLPTALLIPLLKSEQYPISLLIVVYGIFMIIQGIHGTREYWLALINEAKLEEKTRELRRLTEIDVLTGIYNRRYFNKTFEQEWKRATREKYPLTLILIDFDHFKQINDTYGHLAGDEYLTESARVMTSTFRRSTDMVVRYGGEEFVIVLPGTDATKAFQLAESLRTKIENLTVSYEQATIRTTISLGIASQQPEYHTSSESLISEADEALYHAKELGRNQTQIKKHAYI